MQEQSQFKVSLWRIIESCQYKVDVLWRSDPEEGAWSESSWRNQGTKLPILRCFCLKLSDSFTCSKEKFSQYSLTIFWPAAPGSEVSHLQVAAQRIQRLLSLPRRSFTLTVRSHFLCDENSVPISQDLTLLDLQVASWGRWNPPTASSLQYTSSHMLNFSSSGTFFSDVCVDFMWGLSVWIKIHGFSEAHHYNTDTQCLWGFFLLPPTLIFIQISQQYTMTSNIYTHTIFTAQLNNLAVAS